MKFISTLASSVSLLSLVVATSGCGVQSEPVASFEPNLVHAMKYQIQEEIPMAEAAQDTHWLALEMFGTPDEPKLPEVITEDEDLASLVSMDHLMLASGPADAPGRGLYRKHCVVCHGVTGDGRGPTAAVQMPYPRDYRMGVFKFKSTPSGSKPAKSDIAKLIKHGIGGTAMIQIPELTDGDIDALVDYVIYLSWRGQLERQTIDVAIFDGMLGEEGDRIINADLGKQLRSNPSLSAELETLAEKDEDALSEADVMRLEEFELYEEAWEYAEDYAVEIGEAWMESQDEVIEVPEPPAGIPVAEGYADVVKFKSGDKAEAFLASVNRGQELFRGKVASCSKCHGENGLGNGQTTDYDDWTKDWTTRVGLKPEDRESLLPLLARGAMEPRNAIPRNFAEGVFRGGSSSADLYLRIMQGIEGSPMPAATFVEGEFQEDDIWHLINFIRSLQTVVPDPPAEALTKA